MAINTNEIPTEGQELHGSADLMLQRAERDIENRRRYIQKALEPVEEGGKELIKATATDEVRLQGTKEHKAPKALRPYVEKVYVTDRKALASLIESAKKENRKWKVGKSMREGFRYVLYMKRPLKEEKEKPVAELDVGIVEPHEGIPSDVEVEIKGEPETSAEEAKLTPFDVMKGLFDIRINGNRTLSICVKGEEGESDDALCLVTRPLGDEEIEILGIEPAEDSKEVDGEAEKGGVEPEERPEESEKGEPKELEEASSAEKRAYSKGGKDLDDLLYGRVIGSIKNRLLRDRAVKAYKGEEGEEGRKAVDDLLGDAVDERGERFVDKEAKMRKKGYPHKEEDDFDDEMDEVDYDAKPLRNPICPNCHQLELNDAGECPYCDLGDASALEDSFKAAGSKPRIDESTKVEDDVDISLDDLQYFKPYAGAKGTWDLIVKAGKVDDLAKALSDFAVEGKMTTTDLNDILWFERDWVLGKLDIDEFQLDIKSGDDVIDSEEVEHL